MVQYELKRIDLEGSKEGEGRKEKEGKEGGREGGKEEGGREDGERNRKKEGGRKYDPVFVGEQKKNLYYVYSYMHWIFQEEYFNYKTAFLSIVDVYALYFKFKK